MKNPASPISQSWFSAYNEAKEIAHSNYVETSVLPIHQKNYGDPWVEEWIARASDKFPKRIVVLQDWGCEGYDFISETMLKAIEDFRKPAEGEKAEATQLGLVHALKQPGGILEFAEDTLILNAVWGLRRGTQRSGPLPFHIHFKSLPVWGRIVRHVVTHVVKNTDAVEIILCGAWARQNPYFSEGTKVTYGEFIESWNAARMRRPSTKTIQEMDILGNSSGIPLHFSRHPSAPGFSTYIKAYPWPIS